jgi:hypothetical protein
VEDEGDVGHRPTLQAPASDQALSVAMPEPSTLAARMAKIAIMTAALWWASHSCHEPSGRVLRAAGVDPDAEPADEAQGKTD